MELAAKPFDALSAQELYEILQARVDVFVVEQRCPYPELDGADRAATHFFFRRNGRVLAYLRALPQPGEPGCVQLGRVLTVQRGLGLGRALMEGVLARLAAGGVRTVRLNAQCQARGFYEKFGFAVCGAPFTEDGIPHVPMVLAPVQPGPGGAGARGPARTLYLIGGAMGVGKSTAARALAGRLPACALLDGDWCWQMHPFRPTPAAREMVLDNIQHVLGNFLRCPDYENAVFCWVMHLREIWAALARGLGPAAAAHGWQVKAMCLVCSPQALRSRAQADGRDEAAAARGVSYLPLYRALGVPVLDTTALTAAAAARAIQELEVTGWPV